jgi:hypothetical protein
MAPKFLNKASYDPSKLSNGHGVLVLSLRSLLTFFGSSFKVHGSIPTFFAIFGVWHRCNEDRRHLNTMQLKDAPSSCPMVEELKEAKWFGFKRTPLAGLVERKA